jgi:hypothetical protein
MGVNRNTSRHMVFSTCTYIGLGLDHLAAVQGFTPLQYLIVSLRTQYTMGDLYQMLLEYTQLECGPATPILEADLSWYEQKILNKNLITECWRYLSLFESMVIISDLWTPMKGSLGDMSLMDKFPMQGLTEKQMRNVNRCYIYLQAFYTSYI